MGKEEQMTEDEIKQALTKAHQACWDITNGGGFNALTLRQVTVAGYQLYNENVELRTQNAALHEELKRMRLSLWMADNI